ncbi:MAG: hypothetical protein RIQ79_1998 [Verrucomicrobiota bacterium]|jgi:hypothetical protein
MSFLSTHRLHWGAHDAITHHIPVQLGLIHHEDVPLHELQVEPAGTPPAHYGSNTPFLRELREGRPGLVDEPGP